MIKFLALCFWMGLTLGSAFADWSIKEMNTAIDQTNFLVNKACSGTLINLEKKYILTAAHCVEAQYEVKERELISNEGVVTKEKYRKLIDGSVTQLLFEDGVTIRTVTYRVVLKAVDKSTDLAVVQVVGPLPNTMAAKLAEKEPQRGEKAIVVGNPAGSLYSSVAIGIVASLERSYGVINFGDAPHERLIQVSSGIIGGNSGGAVYNADGELFGVPVVAHRTHETLGFVVPLGVVKKFLADRKLD